MYLVLQIRIYSKIFIYYDFNYIKINFYHVQCTSFIFIKEVKISLNPEINLTYYGLI